MTTPTADDIIQRVKETYFDDYYKSEWKAMGFGRKALSMIGSMFTASRPGDQRTDEEKNSTRASGLIAFFVVPGAALTYFGLGEAVVYYIGAMGTAVAAGIPTVRSAEERAMDAMDRDMDVLFDRYLTDIHNPTQKKEFAVAQKQRQQTMQAAEEAYMQMLGDHAATSRLVEGLKDKFAAARAEQAPSAPSADVSLTASATSPAKLPGKNR